MNLYQVLTGNYGDDGGQKAGARVDNTGGFQTASTNINPRQSKSYQPNVKRLGEISNLPTGTTKKQVVAIGKEALRMKATNFKLNTLARHQLSVARELDRGIQISTNYQSGMMDVVNSVENTTAQFGIKEKQFSLQSDITVQGYAAFVDEWEKGGEETTNALGGW